MTRDDVLAEFVARYHSPPDLLVRAPGRVNLIGEHTDYNHGFVLPMAIDRWLWIALRRRRDDCVAIYSCDYRQQRSFSLSRLQPAGDGNWLEYVKGVAWALQQNGQTLDQGWDGIVAGDIPIGAGLSSSAALEMASARAFAAVAAIPWQPLVMAKIGQQAENDWIGVNCGIMDQMICAAGQSGHALLIDCRSLQYRAVSLPTAITIVVMDTNTRRGLVESAYNQRRSQCEQAARFFQVAALRDVAGEDFHKLASLLDEDTRSRVRHVIGENARTVAAAAAIERQDLAELGRLINASHHSLRDDFAVSSRELDIIVAGARSQPGCYGARMTGAGFGGCALAIVAQQMTTSFVSEVTMHYQQHTGISARIYVCQASAGAEVVMPAP